MSILSKINREFSDTKPESPGGIDHRSRLAYLRIKISSYDGPAFSLAEETRMLILLRDEAEDSRAKTEKTLEWDIATIDLITTLLGGCEKKLDIAPEMDYKEPITEQYKSIQTEEIDMAKVFKLIVVGSRTFQDITRLNEVLDEVQAHVGADRFVEIICEDDNSVGKMAKAWATKTSSPSSVYGKRSGEAWEERHQEMIDYAKATAAPVDLASVIFHGVGRVGAPAVLRRMGDNNVSVRVEYFGQEVA
ncbi:hypothetical protein KAR91_38655 [Candidatus Pacearchaeota archaeon]|nr:hypothetical protein [Candidatus Pacearchaeota archaeon]